MSTLAVLTPSFRGDARLFADLHASVLANTASSVVHHVVVPPADLRLFRQYEGSRCRVLTHRDFLPRSFISIPHASGLAVNVRRPWPPVRGGDRPADQSQLAGTAALDAQAVLSRGLRRRPGARGHLRASPPQDGRPRNYRADAGTTADVRRHLHWHEVARLGCAAVRQVAVTGARARLRQPDRSCGTPRSCARWPTGSARATGANVDLRAEETRFSWVVIAYAVGADELLGGVPVERGAVRRNCCAAGASQLGKGLSFAESIADALGAMISTPNANGCAGPLQLLR